MSMMLPIIARPRDDIYTVLKKLGLAGGLHTCLDAGQETSAPASTNKWVDLSGGGNGFFRGANTGAEATLDVDFVGTVGRRDKDTYWENGGGTEYFSFEKAITTPYNDAHKNNQKWSFASWWYVTTTGSNLRRFLATNGAAANSGFAVQCLAANVIRLHIGNGSGTLYCTTAFTGANIAAGWNFIGLAVEIASNVLTVNVCTGGFMSDGVAPSTTGAPSSASALGPPEILRDVSGVVTPAGDRVNSLCWWSDVKLTAAQFEAVFQATRGKFGV